MNNELLRTCLHKLSALNKSTIFFGPQGFALAITEQALKQAQHGFSRKPDSSTLPSNEAGNWQSNWLVIATDTELGDPYFVDTSTEKLIVYTAMLTDNGWQKEQVANSLVSFINCLKILDESNNQTNATIIPDETSITDVKRLLSLKTQLITFSDCESFWTLFFECYHDWLLDLDEE